MSRSGKDPVKRVKTARGRTASSNRWLSRQLNDPYVRQAKVDGYRSRAAYKLAELDEKFGVLKGAKRVVDLGVAPGGWAQVVRKKRPAAAVVGIDLLPTEPIDGATLLQMDFMDEEAPAALVEAGNYLNTHFSGLALEQVALRLKGEVENLRSEIAALMQAAIAASTEAAQDEQNDVVIAGERNLLEVSDFAQDMSQLRRAFNLFEQKTLLMRLLDETSQAAGIRIYIGGENQSTPLEELSMVSAPYAVNGQVVGTLGVIGPTRMPYQRMIEIVDITSRMIGHALSPH